MKTYMAKPETAQKEWFVVDADGGSLLMQMVFHLEGLQAKLPTFCAGNTSQRLLLM